MKFTLPAATVRDLLSVARAAVPTSGGLVAYSGVLLLIKADRLNIIGSDGDTTVAASAPAPDSDDGEALVPPRQLAGFLSELPADAAVTAQLDAHDLVVTVAGLASPYTFKTIQARFPRPPAARSAPVEASFDGLADAVAAVRDGVDHSHGGVLVVSDDTELRLFATDQYQLHAAVLQGAGFGEFTGVVPLHVLDRVARHQVTAVVPDTAGRTLRFSGDGLLISTRLLSVALPDMEGVLSASPPNVVRASTEELRHRLARLMAVTGREPAVVSASASRLRIAASNIDSGSGSETMDVTGDATATVTLDPHRLLTAVAAHHAPEVELMFGDELHPVFVRTTAGRLSSTTVVSPIRV